MLEEEGRELLQSFQYSKVDVEREGGRRRRRGIGGRGSGEGEDRGEAVGVVIGDEPEELDEMGEAELARNFGGELDGVDA